MAQSNIPDVWHDFRRRRRLHYGVLFGGILAVLALAVVVLVRIAAIGVAWRSTDQWSAITEAIKRQPETRSFGWLPPQNRAIRYVVGPEPNDAIDATAGRWGSPGSRIEARSGAAATVLQRAVRQVCGDRQPLGVSVRYPR